MTDAGKPKTPEIITVEHMDTRLVIAALVLGIVLGALIIVMLPDNVFVEDTNNDG